MVYTCSPPTTQEDNFADEKERKAENFNLLMAVPKDHSRRFQGMMIQREPWAAINTRLVLMPNSEENPKKLHHLLSPLASDNVSFQSQAKASSKQANPSPYTGSIVLIIPLLSKASPSSPTATPGRRPRVDGKKHVALILEKLMFQLPQYCILPGSASQRFKRRYKQEAGYEEEISIGIFASRETDAGNYDIPLYSRFKQVEYKGKYGLKPQSPSPTESDWQVHLFYSTFQSNDSDWGTRNWIIHLSQEHERQREGKAPTLSEETPKTTKEQILQKKLSLHKKKSNQVGSYKRIGGYANTINAPSCTSDAEEEELTIATEEKKSSKLSKSMLGSELQGEDFAKKMVDLVNQRKKFFAEERAKAKRNKPMTQSQLKTYMMNYLKNQGSWKLNQLRKLSFEEVKEEFDKLVRQVESFAPISFEATKDSLKRFGEELQTKTPKRLKEDKDDEAKDDESTKKSGKRRKQIARKGMHTSVEKNDSEESDKVDDQEETNTEKKEYTKLYGMDGPEDKLEKGFWKCLRIMFEEPLSTDSIWSEIEQQKIVSWRYYDTSRVHCLNLESMDVYLLSDRKYLLSAEVCKTMLKMKLLDGKMSEDCYRLLKMMGKQAGIRK
ncbi:hypothetical protein Tco_0527315 [Tanacetum coccineum]